MDWWNYFLRHLSGGADCANTMRLCLVTWAGVISQATTTPRIRYMPYIHNHIYLTSGAVPRRQSGPTISCRSSLLCSTYSVFVPVATIPTLNSIHPHYRLFDYNLSNPTESITAGGLQMHAVFLRWSQDAELRHRAAHYVETSTRGIISQTLGILYER